MKDGMYVRPCMWSIYCLVQAERAIKDGAEQGLWVILQNCESLKDVCWHRKQSDSIMKS